MFEVNKNPRTTIHKYLKREKKEAYKKLPTSPPISNGVRLNPLGKRNLKF